MPTASRAEPGQDLLDKAKQHWPVGGRRPDLDDFCLGPLAAALFRCERRFDTIPPDSPGSPVRQITVEGAGLFPLMVFADDPTD